jgi:hypothetical protein
MGIVNPKLEMRTRGQNVVSYDISRKKIQVLKLLGSFSRKFQLPIQKLPP